MKYVIKELTPRPDNDLFITQYWADKQTDPPLHFHDDYMLSLTLNMRGTRVTGHSVDDFTEKDLIIIFPGVPHCYWRNESYANMNCEAVAVQFSRDMPNWKIFATESMEPIRKMLSRPVAGLQFSEKIVDRVRERLLKLPEVRGFESVSLFLDILNDLASAGPADMELLDPQDYKTHLDSNQRIKKILQFVENNYHRKISLEDIGAEIGMSPSSVCRFFKKSTYQNLWNYINGFRIVRAAQMIVETDAPISEISIRCGFYNISNFNHAFRNRIGTTPGEYRRKFGSTVISPDEKQVEEISRKLNNLRTDCEEVPAEK
ncbi:AraC family transcriptional regulator [uncultured Alistipes sp.]|jgi:transcriptional regulator containing an amidase domain and an araC-type DNA-binding HTH domain|uniref:AraC family transcriptional regulator n=1 Tax=uncultured Alistipes sp. TaxID=538949 RepID=UPI0025D2D8C4|nr:AraC family transcriptional regulator [uncultured Alistipes sp.]